MIYRYVFKPTHPSTLTLYTFLDGVTLKATLSWPTSISSSAPTNTGVILKSLAYFIENEARKSRQSY